MTINQQNLATLQSTANAINNDSIEKKSVEENISQTVNNSAETDLIEKELPEEDSVDITHLRTPIKVDLSPVYNFLGARTTQAWVDAAIENLPMIIQDHANCEKKAAGTAMNLIFRYEFSYDLQRKLAQLIREEMLHYEQVLGIMNERGQEWKYLSGHLITLLNCLKN